jgi:hypothetical protein
MTRNIMSVLIALCLSAGIASAQWPGEEILRDFPTPTSARLEAARDGSAQLAIDITLTDGCTEPVTTLLQTSGNAWFVDVYRELPPDILCAAVLSPVTITVPADDLFVEGEDGSLPSFIVINEVVFAIDRLSGDQTLPTLSTIETRQPVDIRMMVFEPKGDGMADVFATAVPADPCGTLIYRATAVWDREGLYALDASTIRTDPDAECTLDEAEELTITLTDQMFYSIRANGAGVPYNTFVPVEEQRPYQLINTLPIETFEIEWVIEEGFYPSVRLSVTGVTDGCDAPTQIALQRLGTSIYQVNAVRVLPLETLCTMIARTYTHEQFFDLPANAPIEFIVNGETITLAQP